MLPPPSRPKYNDQKDNTNIKQQEQHQQQHQQQQPQSTIISHPNQIVETRQASQAFNVPSLSVQYIPNVGYKYYAVVPSYYNNNHQQQYHNSDKWNNLKSNDIYDKQDKLNGKYNAKLKKYKAYEKLKYIPYYSVVRS